MNENPYAPSRASVAREGDDSDVPYDIRKKIRDAALAGAISAVITLVFTLVAISGTSLLGLTIWNLLDVALIGALAFGIYQRSRTCAVILLVYFISSKVYLMIQTDKLPGLVGSIVALTFIYFYACGIQGTFAYHSWLRWQGAARGMGVRQNFAEYRRRPRRQPNDGDPDSRTSTSEPPEGR